MRLIIGNSDRHASEESETVSTVFFLDQICFAFLAFALPLPLVSIFVAMPCLRPYGESRMTIPSSLPIHFLHITAPKVKP